MWVGDDPYHEPIRLLTVLQASLERITAVVSRNEVLRHFFDGGWVTLAARAHVVLAGVQHLLGGQSGVMFVGFTRHRRRSYVHDPEV